VDTFSVSSGRKFIAGFGDYWLQLMQLMIGGRAFGSAIGSRSSFIDDTPHF
jgi:hypothetical protein